MKILHNFIVIVTLTLVSQLWLVTGLGFVPGMEYWYDLEATTHVQDAATIYTAAKVSLSSIILCKHKPFNTV